jgi:hypothetical protein
MRFESQKQANWGVPGRESRHKSQAKGHQVISEGSPDYSISRNQIVFGIVNPMYS